MALTKKTNKILLDRLKLIDKSIDDMNVENIQENIFKNLRIFLMTELSLDKEGNIKRTSSNLRAINKVRKLKSLIFVPEYLSKVNNYINSFDKVKELSDRYITRL